MLGTFGYMRKICSIRRSRVPIVCLSLADQEYLPGTVPRVLVLAVRAPTFWEVTSLQKRGFCFGSVIRHLTAKLGLQTHLIPRLLGPCPNPRGPCLEKDAMQCNAMLVLVLMLDCCLLTTLFLATTTRSRQACKHTHEADNARNHDLNYYNHLWRQKSSNHHTTSTINDQLASQPSRPATQSLRNSTAWPPGSP